MVNTLDGMVWMQDAMIQTGKSRWWIAQRCFVYKKEYQTRWRSYVKQSELDRAMAVYRADVGIFKEVSTPKISEAVHA